MKNYYQILGIKQNLTEEELYKSINEKSDYAKLLGGKENEIYVTLCENFLKTLEHYGSKENYDRALGIKYSKKVSINKNFKFNKKVALKIGGIVLAGTAIVTLISLDTTKVPVYTGQTLGDICAEYNISELEIIGDGLKNKDYTFKDDSSLTVVSTNKKIDTIDTKIENQNKKEEQSDEETYGFYYIVKAGDTASGLKESLKLSHMPSKNLYQGDKIWLETIDPKIAEEMEREYEIDTAEPEPSEYEYYEVQSGDNLGTISEKFGVTPQILVEFNNISNPQSIYAGQKLIIVYEYVTGEEAIALREQKQETNKSLS